MALSLFTASDSELIEEGDINITESKPRERQALLYKELARMAASDLSTSRPSVSQALPLSVRLGVVSSAAYLCFRSAIDSNSNTDNNNDSESINGDRDESEDEIHEIHVNDIGLGFGLDNSDLNGVKSSRRGAELAELTLRKLVLLLVRVGGIYEEERLLTVSRV